MVAGSRRTRGFMPLLSQQAKLYTKDEELGKRDDDFRPKKKTESMSAQLNPLRWRRRRLFAILAVVVCVYFFIKNIPTDLGSADSRINPAFRPPRPGTTLSPPPPPPGRPDQKKPVVAKEPEAATAPTEAKTRPVGTVAEPTGAPPNDGTEEEEDLSRRNYNGGIRYYRLAATLNQHSVTANKEVANRNVVFAASALKSVANLLPIACEMGYINTNSVHFVLLSRSDLSVDEIRSLNGLDNEDCPIIIHDARSDFNEYSSDLRHEKAVAGAIAHINAHIAPHAIIVDDQELEDRSFSRAVQKRAKEYMKVLIEIPAGRYDDLMYISQLDYASLEHWHTPTIDIVIHVPNDTAGSLMRLLRTLTSADYSGIRLPKLTLDLATSIPQALKSLLGGFKWPQRYEPETMDVDTVTLRHHVQSQKLNTEQAAMRFLESYYPAGHDNHVLILSPQAEVSAQFLRYLHYNILEYKYKMRKSYGTGELLGIALEVPTMDIGGRTAFIAPEMDVQNATDRDNLRTPFLYTVPTSSSLLIFGDKWQVFHDYLTHRTNANHLGKATQADKVVSETEPAWMEYLLELMRARGWHVLYPAHSFATVHNELAQIPEEFARDATSTASQAAQATKLNEAEPFVLAPEAPVIKQHPEERLPTVPLHQSLPYRGILPKLDKLPFITHEGELIDMSQTTAIRDEYVVDFRKRIGGCSDEDAARPRVMQEGKADDLFCLPTVDVVFDLKAEQAASSS